MIVTCWECDTSFKLGDSLVKPGGTKVRCSKCKRVFSVYPPEESGAADMGKEESGPLSSNNALKSASAALAPESAQVDKGDDLDFGPLADNEQVSAVAGLEETDTAKGLDDSFSDDFDFSDLESMIEKDEAFFQKDRTEDALDDLSLDILDSDGSSAVDAADEDELNLADIESMLEMEESTSNSEKAQADKAPIVPDKEILKQGTLDLADIEKMIAKEDLAETDDIDIEGLELEPMNASSSLKDNDREDHLDLSDLEKMIDSDAPETESGSLLQMESEALQGDASSQDIDAENSLELAEIEKLIDKEPASEKELETDDVIALSGEDDQGSTEGIDLSSIEGLLEEEEEATETTGSVVETVRSKEPSTSEDEKQKEGELNIGDIERMIDEEEPVETVGKGTAVPQDLELEFDIEDEPSETEKRASAEKGDDDDISLEFEFEEDQAPETLSAASAASAMALEKDNSVGDYTATFDMGDLDEKEESVKPPVMASPRIPTPKKRVSLPLLILLAIILIVGSLFGAAPYLKKKGIQIPFISDLMAPKTSDSGNLKIKTEAIDSRFVDNTSAGRLFVISGMTKNNYLKPRRFVKVTGKLFVKGKKLVKTETVVAGNVVSDIDLANLPYADITKRIKKRTRADKSVITMPPGTTLPFMIVFSDIPTKLDEYTIEVTGSSPVK